MDFGRKKGENSDSNVPATVLVSTHKVKDYAASSMKCLNELRLSKTLSDVRLVGEPMPGDAECVAVDEIPANRCILAARSDYFKAMFTIGMTESQQQTIRIHDISHHILTKVVEFIYCGCCKVTKDEVQDLTSASAMLQIDSLHQACREMLKENLDLFNIFRVWSLADTYQFSDILRCCAVLIPNYLGVLLEQEEFTQLPASMIHTILKYQKVNLGPKQDSLPLRTALAKWVNHNKNDIEQMSKLQNYVDLHALKIYFQLNTRKLPETITSLPPCFSLIAVLGGFLQSRTSGKCPTANTVEVLDTHSLNWQTSCDIRTEHRPVAFRTAFVSDGMLYFIAKDWLDLADLYQYEPVMGQWARIRSIKCDEALYKLSESIKQVRAIAENGHEIYLSGSVTIGSSDQGRTALKIDVKKNTVESLPLLPSPRYHHGSVVVNGDLFVIGGSTISWEPLDSVLILREGQKEWGHGFPMSEPRVGPGVAVLGNFIYCVGGTSTKRLRTAERYHITLDCWQTLPAMNSPRAFPGAASASGRLFVFGGKSYAGSEGEDSGARNVLNTCEMYDPDLVEWEELPSMEKFRCEMLTLTI